jgi:hypothetical protein
MSPTVADAKRCRNYSSNADDDYTVDGRMGSARERRQCGKSRNSANANERYAGGTMQATTVGKRLK